MNIVRPDRKIEMFDGFQQFFAPALRHTAHDSEDHVRMLALQLLEDAELADRLAFRLFTDTARIQDDDVGVLLGVHDMVSGGNQHGGGGLGVALIHLTAVGLDIYVHFTTYMLLR